MQDNRGIEYVPSIARITDSGAVFQVLNSAGDDWDEQATNSEYEAWRQAQGQQ